MNTKSLLYLSCLLAALLTTSTVNAGPHRRGHNNFNSARTRSGVARNFIGGNRIANWNGQRWRGRNFVGKQYWSGNHSSWYWHHHHRRFRDFVFIDVGFPFFGSWGYPYYYDYYPYGCYPSAYPYGYSGGGYYDNGYYGSSNYSYGNGYGYDNNSYGYTNGSNVAELQRKLADAGYYRGPIDGIMGSRTYYALKAYRHDRAIGKNINGGYNPTLRDKPYSPPPITNEPESTE
jgi:hypothetical protein